MIELIDSYYSEILSKESMRGLKQTAQQGYHTGGKPPYGYRLKSVLVGSSVKKLWEAEPKEAEGVKLIYRMHADGHSYHEIIAELKNRRIKPRNKDEWGAVPFGFRMGRRGGLVGIGTSVAIAMAYWGTFALFRSLGGAGVLTPFLGAGGANVTFGQAGLVGLFRIRT